MNIKECIRQLESLKDHCRSMVDEQDPEDIWRDDVEALQFALEALRAQQEKEENPGEVSDGYHTFNELYHHRAVLFSVICNANPERAWKSKLHNTGAMYDSMFIVGIETPDGQATYHYDIDPYWEMFRVKELDRAPVWDGHSPNEAIRRIGMLSREKNEPLTMDELRGMDGEPVYIVEYPDWGHWELSEDAADYLSDRDTDFYGMMHDDPCGKNGLHALGWLAYRHKPGKGDEIDPVKKPPTNADRIRAMSDEELANELCDLVSSVKCDSDCLAWSFCRVGHVGFVDCLQQPAEEGGGTGEATSNAENIC